MVQEKLQEEKNKKEREYYLKNKDKILARKKELRKEHPGRNKTNCKKHYLANKDYFIEKNRKRREQGYDWINKYKSKLSCIECGESNIACLDFHHIDPTQKTRTVSQMVNRGCSEKRLLEEIDKCIVLCANCHRKLHCGKEIKI